jgi:ureidoglycolate dehydrogenase (NAD+)
MTPEAFARPPLRSYCAGDGQFLGPTVTPVPRTGAPQRELQVIGEDEARWLTRAALADAGLCATDAHEVADALVDSSLRGIDIHGLRLLPQYLDELATGVANATAMIRVVSDRGAGLLIDADGALGVVAGLAAARLAAKRAGKFGVAAVGVRNSNHFGAASVYTRQLARDGLVGIAVTSAPPRVAPGGGVEPLFGTSPISVAAGDGNDEFALDIGNSQVGLGQGLGTAVTLLGSVLTGAPLDWQLSQVGEEAPGQGGGVGHLLLALDPAAFTGQAQFSAGLADLLGGVRAAAPADPSRPELAPGDPQRAQPHAIPLDQRTGDVLSSLATELGVPGPRSVFAD